MLYLSSLIIDFLIYIIYIYIYYIYTVYISYHIILYYNILYYIIYICKLWQARSLGNEAAGITGIMRLASGDGDIWRPELHPLLAAFHVQHFFATTK